MSLFNSQTIFNILITLIICSALFMYFRFRLRVLEISQREQAKVLQSLVMNMKNPHRENMISDEEIMKHVQMQMQQDGSLRAGAGVGAGGSYNQQQHHQHNRANDLIDVSDDEDDEEDDEDDDDSGDDSDSSCEDDSDDGEDDVDNHDNTTKKIIFNNGGPLDSQTIEHLTGDDIKVIELTEPLYPVGGSHSGSKHDASDDDDDDDDDNDDNDDNDANDNDDEESSTSDDNQTEVKVEQVESFDISYQEHQQQLPSHEEHLETSITEVKTIFKADKQHTDYNSMNVQTLRQHLKTKLSNEGLQYNETSINKLNKKELIKHLTQG